MNKMSQSIMGEDAFFWKGKQLMWTGLPELRESFGNAIDLKTKSTKTQKLFLEF